MASKWTCIRGDIKGDVIPLALCKGDIRREDVAPKFYIRFKPDLLIAFMNLKDITHISDVQDVAQNFISKEGSWQEDETLIANQELLMNAIESFLSRHDSDNDGEIPVLSFDNIDDYLGEEKGYAKNMLGETTGQHV